MNFELNGFSVVLDLLSRDETDSLYTALKRAQEGDHVRKKSGTYAIRNLLAAVPEVADLAASKKLSDLVEPVLGGSAFAVRATLFDKTSDANWLVPWHQDLTISVRDRIETPGYGPWTTKAGVPHVQPPVAVLESMLAVRIHLDDCNERNGALRVLPGSHRSGRLSAEQLTMAQQNTPPVMCAVGRGGAVMIKPLIVHSSSAAEEPSHRRVVHIDFAACDLANGLKWFRSRG